MPLRLDVIVLRATHPVIAALATLLEPLTAAILSAVVLHEDFGIQGWCGATLLAAGLLVGYLRSGGSSGRVRPRMANGRGSPAKW